MAARTKTRKSAQTGARSKARAGAVDYNKMFRKISREYEKFLYKCFPTYGTYMGLVKYDKRLSKPTPAFFRKYAVKVAEFLERIAAIPALKLSLDNKVDRDLAMNELEMELEEMENRPGWKRQPSMYFSESMYGIYTVLTRAGENLLSRADGVIARTEGLPRQIAQGMKNLDNPPRIFTENAIMSAHGARMFFDGTVRDFASKIPKMKARRLKVACNRAVAAIGAYIKWLEEDLLPRSQGRWKEGKTRFNKTLRKYHEVPFNADSLYALGQRVYNDTLQQMTELAAKIDKRTTWEKIVAKLKQDHPTNSELVRYYAGEMARARSFVQDNDLATFPPEEAIRVVQTPDFARPLIPYAAYLTPGLYEKEQTGIFWVTTVAPGTPKDRAKEQLEGHSKYGIVVTSLHEAYPGHHLQLTRANMKPRIWRHLHHTSVFAEGWALYCEEMMYEEGFYSDPRVRLLQLKDQLWRACRVMIDVSLHTRKMSPEEAVNFLVEKAHLERPNAEAEVRRYCQSPTQPMSYVTGKHLVLALRRKYRKAMGSKFSLKSFHDALIDHGTIPIRRVEKLMGL